MKVPQSLQQTSLFFKWQRLYTNSDTIVQNPLVTYDMSCKRVGQETMKENESALIQPTEPVSSEQWRKDTEKSLIHIQPNKNWGLRTNI